MANKPLLFLTFSALPFLASTLLATNLSNAAEIDTVSSEKDNIATLYHKECGNCHLAYPARLHTIESWRKVMANLSDHFGDNAELDLEKTAKITRYLITHAKSSFFPFKNHPLRITKTHYFQIKHETIPKGAVGPHTVVKSFAQCEGCHQHAALGSYREREIKIPGFLTWDN